MTTEPRELRGRDAEVFAEEHLKQVKVNPETWEVEYVDPETGLVWILDYPNGEAHGGGEPRLRMQDMSVGSDAPLSAEQIYRARLESAFPSDSRRGVEHVVERQTREPTSRTSEEGGEAESV